MISPINKQTCQHIDVFHTMPLKDTYIKFTEIQRLYFNTVVLRMKKKKKNYALFFYMTVSTKICGKSLGNILNRSLIWVITYNIAGLYWSPSGSLITKIEQSRSGSPICFKHEYNYRPYFQLIISITNVGTNSDKETLLLRNYLYTKEGRKCFGAKI